MIELLNFIALLYAIIPHEVAHGKVAEMFGDSTARNLGRLTYNPVPHIDILGSILLPGLLLATGSSFIIGWAKPVPVQMRFFRNPIRDMMWVALAGPLTNISLAVMSSFLYKGILLSVGTPDGLLAYFLYFLRAYVQINIVLAVFNLIPIPPLDGSRVLMNFVPAKVQYYFSRVEPYGFGLIFLLAYLGILNQILVLFATPLIQWLL